VALADKPRKSVLPHGNVVFVVDDDPAMLRSIARLLRQFGYDSMMFPSAEAFANHADFENAACIVLDINLGDGLGIELRHGLKATGNSVPVIYVTGNEPRRSRGSASIRMPRLSHKAVLGEVADGAARESVGFLTLPTIDCRFSLAGDPARGYRSISLCWRASFLFRFFFCSMNHNHAKPRVKITITIKMAYSIIVAALS